MRKGTLAVLIFATGICHAMPIELGAKKSISSNVQAIREVLTDQGYQVPYASKADGMVTATFRNAKLSAADADCGSMLGMSYLKDSRAYTNVDVTVTSIDDAMNLDVKIYGALRLGLGLEDKELYCTSTGLIEEKLSRLIKAAAINMPDEPVSPAPVLIVDEAPPPSVETPVDNLNKSPKTPSDAIEVVDIKTNIREVNYRDAVTMSIQYKSKTSKRIIGIVTRITATNAFGKTVMSELFEDEVAVEPGQISSGDQYWHWQNNPFINNEPYDRMWQSVQNDTLRTKSQVIKVIFDDGSKVEYRPPAPKKKK